ncbi:NnrU family protein [Rugamonas sp. CCM 8940]|uniref:NnrU family protein n=1 Tax=Rugamonas sp. CCM 8940 TaxID=2765359 RepID=UPI0018F6C695|nr:NnrU family protein [Rugamonas sp. CCM 8940]MBJ7312869.1 NnrU family protein [Rugamonas sp. CCM 8940]
MTILLLGLILFLGTHSIRIVAEPWRQRQLVRQGQAAWKGVFSLVSLLGFGLIIWGFGLARQQPVVLWQPPVFLRHLNGLFMVVAFVLLAATYVPRNRIKAAVHHPMMLATKVWAFGHLLANGKAADVLLFGAFLLWAALAFRAARQRDRAAGTSYPAGTLSGTLTTIAVGLLGFVVFAFWLHGVLIGVRPFG